MRLENPLTKFEVTYAVMSASFERQSIYLVMKARHKLACSWEKGWVGEISLLYSVDVVNMHHHRCKLKV